MSLMKLQLAWACRLEHLSSGFYSSLARRYRKKEVLSQTLARFSKDEYRHGVMFGRALKDEYGKILMAGAWTLCGRILAFSQFIVPLRWKLKLLSTLEGAALGLLKRELRSETPNRYRTILRKIRSDEERHAGFYASLYQA